MRYRAFVFDLDGTLVDSRPAIEKAAQMALRKVLPDYRGRSIATVVGPPIRQMFQLTLGGVDEITLDRLVAVFRQAYDSGVCRETPAYPHVSEMLASLASRGASNFVLTNKPHVPTRQILSQLGIEQPFCEVLTPDSPTHPFHSKTEALRALLRRRNLPESATMMVGDSVDDATAAEACGVVFGAAVYGYGDLQPQSGRTNWLTIRCPLDILSLCK